MSQLELSKKAEVSISTLQNIENDEEAAKATSTRTLERIKITLENEGLKFLNPKEGCGFDGAGVKLWAENKKDRA